jgi:hypothetical protein
LEPYAIRPGFRLSVEFSIFARQLVSIQVSRPVHRLAFGWLLAYGPRSDLLFIF